MATKTLLQLTQNILSAMDSDEVTSIYDSVEALQVATIINETAEAEFNNLNLPSLNRIIQLEGLSDVSHPNYMRYGGDVNEIGTLRYRDARNSNRYSIVEYVTPEEFFDRQLLYTGTGDYTRLIVDFTGVNYYIKTNKSPSIYTSIDNNLLVFDSHDADNEDTLHASRSFAFASAELGSLELADDFVYPIPSNLFPLLLAEAKSTCFVVLKQSSNPKAEQVARRQRSRMQKNIYKSAKANNPYARSKFDFSRNR